jgi:YVTN family beta-propeller protein
MKVTHLFEARTRRVALAAALALAGASCGESTGPGKGGPPAALAVAVQPANVVAGAPITPSVRIVIRDANGKRVDTSQAIVTLALTAGTGTAGAHLRGLTSSAAVDGVAVFPTLSIDSAGTGFTLQATASGLRAATSSAFDVTPGPAARLRFGVQPTATRATVAISPAITVVMLDSLGNYAASATNTVTLAISTNPPGNGALSGTASRTAASGMATFNDLSIDKPGYGYVLQASSQGLSPVQSVAFAVLPPPGSPGHPVGTSVVAVPLGSRPYGVAVSGTGAAWVSQFDTDSVVAIDPFGGTVTTKFSVGSGPIDMVFKTGATLAYVANYNDQSVGLVNSATLTQTTTWPVAGQPFRVLLGPGGTKLYVTLNNGTVAVLDAATGTLRKTVPIGVLPNGLGFTSSGSRLYVSDYINGTVTEINPAADTVTRSFSVGSGPQEVVVAPGDSLLFVGRESGQLIVWNLKSWTAQDSIPLVAAFALALTPDQTQIWMTQALAGSVSVIDLATRKVVQTIPVGGMPRRIAFTPDGSTAVVANESGSVQLIH